MRAVDAAAGPTGAPTGATADATAGAPGLERAGRPRCELATEADDASLRALLRDAPMDGWVRLAFPREPSFFGAASLEGEHAGTVVVRRGPDGRVVGTGSRTVKAVWWEGGPARLGYLGQLRFAGGWRAGRRTLVRGYELMRSCRTSDELPFDLTAIVADNAPARRLLERGLPGLPRYTPLAELVTVVVPARARRPAARRIRVEEAEEAGPTAPAGGPSPLDEMARLLERSGRARRLAPRWSREGLAELAAGRLGGWTPLVAREGGRAVGCAAVWDQRAHRQCVVAGYRTWVSRLRPLLSGALRAVGRPGLPPAGSALRLGYLSHLSAEDPEVVEALVTAARAIAARRGLEHLALALPAGRPELARIRRRVGGHTYRSVLYAVQDPDVGGPRERLDPASLEVEVATL